MTIDASIADLAVRMTAWRRDIHRFPELAFAERRTAKFIADKLQSLGLTPVTNIGGTGVVAVIEGAEPGPAIAFRADMDALPMNDEGGKAYASTTPGQAHACGHDGHSAALLGLAHHLADNPPARGRAILIFQPAEENGQGARAMIRDGLLERFHFDQIYAFHNMPLLARGTAGVRSGPTLNGYIIWEVDIEGVGGHAAAFYEAVDPLQTAARLAVEISSLVGRYVDPSESALITVGKLEAGSTHNIIPARASLSGAVRALSPEIQNALFARLTRTCEPLAKMTGCSISCRSVATVPPCVNDPEAADLAAAACAGVLGAAQVKRDFKPFPFTDDFALFLEAAPGAYLFLGQDSVMCHHPAYDFDDDLLPIAVQIFSQIAKAKLGRRSR